jgi:hypothetical protein
MWERAVLRGGQSSAEQTLDGVREVCGNWRWSFADKAKDRAQAMGFSEQNMMDWKIKNGYSSLI